MALGRNLLQPRAEAAPGHEGIVVDLHEIVLADGGKSPLFMKPNKVGISL